MILTKDDKINYVNIGLMILSAISAFYLPFETFLIAYAFLGPLHYLTEISWLHDRQYFTKDKYDFIVLLVIGVLFSMAAFAKNLSEWGFNYYVDIYEYFAKSNLFDQLIVLAFFSAILFAFVKNIWIKLFVIFFLYLFISGWLSPLNTNTKPSTTVFALTSLLPTLIHVYLFTGLFMLFGALKSRSKTGLLSIVFFVVTPIILVFYVPTDSKNGNLTNYGKKAYYAEGDGFFSTNVSILDHFQLIDDPYFSNADFIAFLKKRNFEKENKKKDFISESNLKSIIDSLSKHPNKPYLIQQQKIKQEYNKDNILLLYDNDGSLEEYYGKPIPSKFFEGYSYSKYNNIVFFSTIGIMLMRFIAFAYLYHYLNWFSKTEIIRWHKVPKIRFVAVVLIWLIACGLYAYDYAIGLSFLFFLSFTHVLLEFPLNIKSIVGIGKESIEIARNGFSKK